MTQRPSLSFQEALLGAAHLRPAPGELLARLERNSSVDPPDIKASDSPRAAGNVVVLASALPIAASVWHELFFHF